MQRHLEVDVERRLARLERPGQEPRPDGFVELLDEDYGVDAAAADAGTIGYEILTALSRRCHRVYRGLPNQC